MIYILPTIVQPFYIILCKTFVEDVSGELMQAAEIDGAGTIREFFNIVLPVIKPIIATVAVLAAVAQWNSIQDTLLMITNDNLSTLQYNLYLYLRSSTSLKSLINTQTTYYAFRSDLDINNLILPLTIIVVAPIIIVYPFLQRYFIKGIMVEGVKC